MQLLSSGFGRSRLSKRVAQAFIRNRDDCIRQAGRQAGRRRELKFVSVQLTLRKVTVTS